MPSASKYRPGIPHNSQKTMRSRIFRLCYCQRTQCDLDWSLQVGFRQPRAVLTWSQIASVCRKTILGGLEGRKWTRGRLSGTLNSAELGSRGGECKRTAEGCGVGSRNHLYRACGRASTCKLCSEQVGRYRRATFDEN
jgi:hypothetical protein